MKFINEDFMLRNKTAKELFYDCASDMPIIDYHCHLNPKMIADNVHFRNLTELMLGGDHYKWRAMRSNGVDERFITGDADDYEKFEKWAETVPISIGNPLFHWTQLELKRYFDVDEILSKETAREIWEHCNQLLKKEEYSTQGLIAGSGVKILCTTDEPSDSLESHQKICNENFKVFPTFRPDKYVEIRQDTFLQYIEKCGCKTLDELKAWLQSRMDFFAENGCRIADHAVKTMPFRTGDADKIFLKALNREPISDAEEELYQTELLAFCAEEYAKRGWAMQLHIGALRNNNERMYKKLGADVGFDSINDSCIAEPLAKFLNHMEKRDMLPKTVLYILNPKDNYVLGTMLGNFQKAPFPGKIQFGSGWWFNDQQDGMREQMKALSNLGLLSRFIGMLTDSRSFISYPRHEYFRRILCSVIGEWVENGEYPNDRERLKMIIQNICYYNAKEYFGF